jgi:tRNA G18 (ribose-2'-O)-methylase SpoU
MSSMLARAACRVVGAGRFSWDHRRVNLLPVTDPADPRVADFAGMRDQTLRLAVEQPLGAFVGEGALVLERAIRHGYAVRSVFAEPAHLPQVEPVMAGRPEPVYVAEREVMREITGYREHPGPLSSYLRKPELPLATVLADARRVVLLEDVSNPANMGVVFRCAAALGMDAVVLTPYCSDPLYRRSVRTSMGEVFAIPWARVSSWPGGLAELRTLGFTVAALTPAPDAVPLPTFAAAAPERLALMFGAEGPGLSDEAMAAADVRVAIPMDRDVDSLNIGTAAAIAFYAVRG